MVIIDLLAAVFVLVGACRAVQISLAAAERMRTLGCP
jgi:hypothetical protein